MDKFEAFQDALALVVERCDVTHATMSNDAGNIEITGTDGAFTIAVTVEIKEAAHEPA